MVRKVCYVCQLNSRVRDRTVIHLWSGHSLLYITYTLQQHCYLHIDILVECSEVITGEDVMYEVRARGRE